MERDLDILGELMDVNEKSGMVFNLSKGVLPIRSLISLI